MLANNVLLGAVAGVTIFFGLLIARWRNASEHMRGLLTLGSAGVLLFLIIEVGSRAMETVEASAKGGSGRLALHYGLLFVVGLSIGMIGLAWLEQGRLSRKSAGAEALEVATMIAIGIGLHNFAEGLAIGQSFAGGAVSLTFPILQKTAEDVLTVSDYEIVETIKFMLFRMKLLVEPSGSEPLW